MPKYNKTQQIACLSYLSNILFRSKRNYNDLVDIITMAIPSILCDNSIQELIGYWKIIWGPVVYSNNSHKKKCSPDHVVFIVLTNQFTTPTYCVSIAGINSKSIWENMIKRELKIKPSNMIEWNSINNLKNDCGKISQGTYIGFNNILNMCIEKDTSCSLNDFFVFGSLENNCEIITTGHGLGSSMSICLALWLKELGNKNWIISTYPSGGPAIGDKIWASYIIDTLGLDHFNGIHNTLDPFIMLWDNIESIPDIYIKDNIQPPFHLKVALKLLKKHVGKNNPYHRCEGWKTFTKEFNKTPPGDHSLFLNQALYQHLNSYVYAEYYDIKDYIIQQNIVFHPPIDE